MLLRICYLLIITSLLGASPTVSTAQDIYVKASQIGLDRDEDAVQALAEIDALIAEVAAQSQPDRRLIFDLARSKVDILIAESRFAEAADAVAELAAFAAQFRGELQKSVTSLHREGAELYARAGNLRNARNQLLAMLEEQRDGGQSAQVWP